MTAQLAAENTSNNSSSNNWFRWFNLALMVYVLLVAVSMVSGGFKWATGDQAKHFFEFASHPIAGLMVGIIATTLIQSSSTVTSIIVGLVAGGLPVEAAIPMVMGANVGTTVTNTIVSLGHAHSKEEFRRAFSCATVHDFFNLFAVAIFLPLEMMFGLLEKISAWLVAPFHFDANMSMKGLDFMGPIIKPVVSTSQDIFSFLPGVWGGVAMIIAGVALIFGAILVIGRLMKGLMIGRAKEILKSAIGRGPLNGIASGTLVTILVQSSSTSTSLMVPLVGANVLKVRDVYPFTLGANIGTCITALLAATAVTGANAIFALQIALVHLVFNVLATVLIFGLPFLRNLPLVCAEWLGNAASEKKMVAVGYLLVVFVALPALIMLLS